MFGLFFNDIPRPFRTHYRCFSVSMLPGNERNDLEHGGKIIMPPSALDQLTRLNIVYPMLFKLTNSGSGRTTHCGVLEFVADEGKVYIPYWMMQNLMIEEGSILQVESTSLPVATFAKFQPHSTDFLDLTNPKAVLESRLRHFACLSTGDVIAIMYNNKVYELSVLETKPSEAVSVIECDLNVDFAPPVGYEEPQPSNLTPAVVKEEDHMDVSDLHFEPTAFVPFSGSGNRLDGKKKRTSSESTENQRPKQDFVRGIPDFDFKVGTLKFYRAFKAKSALSGGPDKKEDGTEPGLDGFTPFKGAGQSLRPTRQTK